MDNHGKNLNLKNTGLCYLTPITGISKGKGFQGAIKRWGNRSGRATHGSHFHNRPGSLGSNTTPGRVIKGKKIPNTTSHYFY